MIVHDDIAALLFDPIFGPALLSPNQNETTVLSEQLAFSCRHLEWDKFKNPGARSGVSTCRLKVCYIYDE